MRYSFSQQEAHVASQEWGCNCGPTALAFALQTSLDVVRPVIPEFEAKRYTSPTMMKAALVALGVDWFSAPKTHGQSRYFQSQMFDEGNVGLVRVQFTGPWTAPGTNGKWAYGYTHWIATWMFRDATNSVRHMVFDVNGGMLDHEAWRRDIVPLLTSGIKRADGLWFPTHIWFLASPIVQRTKPASRSSDMAPSSPSRHSPSGHFAAAPEVPSC
jgi:hypothetical protein